MPTARRRPSLSQFAPAKEACLELSDNSVIHKSATKFFAVNARNPAPLAAKLTQQFIAANRKLAVLLDVRMESIYDGNDLFIAIRSGNSVGAVPLISPQTAKHDFGLVIQPRFEWGGIGPMLSEMGWRIAPVPLKLPLLRRSERKVPPWVLSSMILIRVAALLDSLSRKFEIVSQPLSAPRGRVDWDQYARRSMPAADFLSLPCTFPDLQDDRRIKGAIRYTLNQQIQSLQSQRQHGAFIHRLIEFAQSLVLRVQLVPVHIPTSIDLQTWMQRSLRNEKFLDGLQAIEWTVEERGLAGLSDLQGLPWRMPMDRFFEAWLETIFTQVARRTGAQIKTGRQSQTTRPIDWQPPYLGSQKSLVPDIWLEWDTATLIIDAKYKRHWEELAQSSWSRLDQEIREDHRHDLFQVLAYTSLAKTRVVIGCLVYPCSAKTWGLLQQSGRLIHKSTITVGERTVHLWLTAVPMMSKTEAISRLFSDALCAVFAG